MTTSTKSHVQRTTSDENVIRRFYTALSAENAESAESALIDSCASDWQSYGNDGRFRPGGPSAFLTVLRVMHASVPDLKWDIKEILAFENRYVVRSQASGTPVAAFLGATPTGKSFNVMAIDVHTIKGGRIVRTYHVEDWMSAIQQVRSGDTQGGH